MALNWSQQQKLFDPDAARPVTVIGAGSVGSHLVMQLASIGATDITVYDADTVESHNIGPSAYELDDFSRFKVDALENRVMRKTGVKIRTMPCMYTGERLRTSVVASVDNMEARLLIWGKVKHNPLVDVFVDTRVTAHLITVYVIKPCNKEHIALYESRLYPSSEAAPSLCGSHGIVYGAGATASIACRALAASWSGVPIRWEISLTMFDVTLV